MANTYTSLSIAISPTSMEKTLIFECLDVADALDVLDVEGDEARALYDGTSEHFKNVFPLMEIATSPFENFLKLFADPDYPFFQADFENGKDDNAEKLIISGDATCPQTIASLIQKCAPSVLPFGFEWSYHCDKLRVGHFGGGYYIVTADKILGDSTNTMMSDALKMLQQHSETLTKG